jgi:hypothetical protein
MDVYSTDAVLPPPPSFSPPWPRRPGPGEKRTKSNNHVPSSPRSSYVLCRSPRSRSAKAILF